MKLENKLTKLILFVFMSGILICLYILNSNKLEPVLYRPIGSIESVGFPILDNTVDKKVKFAMLDSMPNVEMSNVNVYRYKNYTNGDTGEVTHADEMIHILRSVDSLVEIDVYAVTDEFGNINNKLLLKALSDISKRNYDVINMSFYTKRDDKITKYINDIYNNGALIVASAGNFGNWEVSYPSSLDSVICIGGITSSGELWSDSNRKGIDYVMPVSFYSELTSKMIQGTSISSILFSALAIRELELNPNFNKDNLIKSITEISINPSNKAILGKGQPCFNIK
jgi:hypothetical protein